MQFLGPKNDTEHSVFRDPKQLNFGMNAHFYVCLYAWYVTCIRYPQLILFQLMWTTVGGWCQATYFRVPNLYFNHHLSLAITSKRGLDKSFYLRCISAAGLARHTLRINGAYTELIVLHFRVRGMHHIIFKAD